MKNLSLRTRLLASYLVLLTLALGVIAIALILLLSAQPAPTQPTYQRLAVIAQSGLTDVLVTPLERPLSADIITERMTEIGDTYHVRVLVANLRNGVVLWDSAGTLTAGDSLATHIESVRLTAALERNLQNLFQRSEVVFGNFDDPDGAEWLFTGVVSMRMGSDGQGILFADSRPTQSLQDSLNIFGVSLLSPILEAAVIGLLAAISLAALISRSIAHPLQAVAGATTAVAEGHFDQRVPVSGPPEVRAVAQAFNRMSAEVLSSQLSQRDFMANVSHDLKTPLTSIQGYSQAIIDGTAQDPTEAAAIIYDEAGRLNRMVIELTDLARIQAGRLSMQTAAIDMGQVAAAISQRLSVVAQKKGVALHVQAEAMPVIAGDGDRLAQVLTNLLSNAIKYTPSGGTVWLTTRVNNGGVEVIVKDTGIGIPEEDLPRVFERFYQVDKARGPKRGTGLGLAITAEIVQAHGGKITVSSAGRGQGTTFTIWLPSPHLSTVVSSSRRP
jgi:two-component system OmpR family sensor kinase